MTYAEKIDGTRAGLNALVERILDPDSSQDPTPVFSRSEVRALVVEAIKATEAIHPEKATRAYGGLSLTHGAYVRKLNREALRVAVLELERGFRGPNRPRPN